MNHELNPWRLLMAAARVSNDSDRFSRIARSRAAIGSPARADFEAEAVYLAEQAGLLMGRAYRLADKAAAK